VEEPESRIYADAKVKESIQRKPQQCIDLLDSFHHPEPLINIVTGAIDLLYDNFI